MAMSAVGILSLCMGIMLLSGTANTLLMKFMVIQKVPTGPNATAIGFDHPYFQTLLMMIGEFLCLLVYRLQKSLRVAKPDGEDGQPAPWWTFAIACCCDWVATTLVNMAYIVIAASIVQMTRGVIVIFTCLFSVFFLGRRQYAYHIMGVALVFVGITLVSLSAFINPTHTAVAQQASSGSKFFGIILCIVAQIFQASMIVYEEKIMSKYVAAPLQVVGMEGFFGIIIGVTVLIILNVTGTESTPAAWYQMKHSGPLFIAVIASVFSIAFFNASGVTVTQQASAVARSTIDCSRTILIWIVELGLGWNSFNVIQLIGFIILAVGTLIYNRLIVLRFLEPPTEALPLAAKK